MEYFDQDVGDSIKLLPCIDRRLDWLGWCGSRISCHPGVRCSEGSYQFICLLSHGTNDAQKTMGIITLGLLISGRIPSFQVPFWVVVVCAAAIALGTSVGSWQLIRTLGSKFYKIYPVHGFASQLTSAAVILAASLVGGPVSTTQVVSTAIMGVGAAERMSKVRWGVAGEIAFAWIFTIPSTALLGAGVYWIINLFVG